jgi:hypothetical protein
MIIVTNGEKIGRLSIAHWWPGRDHWWETPSVPAFMIRDSKRKRSRYMTVASARFEDGEVAAVARCCKRDQPSREVGRFIALLRLARTLKRMGYRIVRT